MNAPLPGSKARIQRKRMRSDYTCSENQNQIVKFHFFHNLMKLGQGRLFVILFLRNISCYFSPLKLKRSTIVHSKVTKIWDRIKPLKVLYISLLYTLVTIV